MKWVVWVYLVPKTETLYVFITYRHAQVIENRKRLIPIIECVLLCGREEISLRGHSDNERIVVDGMPLILILLLYGIIIYLFCTHDWLDDLSREGNFRGILKYRAKGDKFLQNILEGPGKRNKYTSPIIQNQIIYACNKIILKKIVAKVNTSKCFSILADETTDITTKEQLSLTVRYIDDDAILREDFLQFYEIESLTGSDLASSILNGNFFYITLY